MALNHKIKKFLHKNFQISGIFSDHEFDQTDFGRIYFNLPEISERPKTIQELATTLKHYNRIGRPVKIRNTGHSTNGQTLTDGVQINIGAIDHISFNKNKMEVTTGCGASWHKVLQAIGFPKYCLPVFPSNPGQEIHIGGTAAASGVGFYSSSQGGFWNHIKNIKVVTMTGEIISCSPEENSEIFRYSLGGFGRIGVIAELTVEIIPSASRVAVATLLYHNQDNQLQDTETAMKLGLSEGLMAFNNLLELPAEMHGCVYSLGFLKEIKNKTELAVFNKTLHEKFNADAVVYWREPDKNSKSIEVDFEHGTFSKNDVVYWYPTSNEQQPELLHPWTDGVVSKKNYPAFLAEARSLALKYNMERHLVRQSFWHGKITLSLIGVYLIRNSGGNFPLTLTLPDEPDYAMGVGLLTNVYSRDIKKALKFSAEMTNLFYEFDGRQYLYGYHNLTKKQVSKHFGNKTIQEWNKLKDNLDPKHLLNIGVIEHLD